MTREVRTIDGFIYDGSSPAVHFPEDQEQTEVSVFQYTDVDFSSRVRLQNDEAMSLEDCIVITTVRTLRSGEVVWSAEDEIVDDVAHGYVPAAELSEVGKFTVDKVLTDSDGYRHQIVRPRPFAVLASGSTPDAPLSSVPPDTAWTVSGVQFVSRAASNILEGLAGIFSKAGVLTMVDEEGTETEIGAGGGGGVTLPIAESDVTNLVDDLQNLDDAIDAITADYTTAAELATALGSYVTSVALAAFNYVTSSSLASTLGSYLTTASAAATYYTSAAATTALALKANLVGPTFTGTVTLPSATALANPAFSGTATGSGTVPQAVVVNLTTDLAAKAATATTVTGTGSLNGGGDLSTNRTLDIADIVAAATYAAGNGSIVFNAKGQITAKTNPSNIHVGSISTQTDAGTTVTITASASVSLHRITYTGAPGGTVNIRVAAGVYDGQIQSVAIIGSVGSGSITFQTDTAANGNKFSAVSSHGRNGATLVVTTSQRVEWIMQWDAVSAFWHEVGWSGTLPNAAS